MATVLTLHQGDAEASFTEHPIEVARRALLEAAEIEGEPWARILCQVAAAIPDRREVVRFDQDAHPAAIEVDSRKREWQERKDAAEQQMRELTAAWWRLDVSERRSKLLQALSGDRLTVGELTDRLNEAVGLVTMVRSYDGSEYTAGVAGNSTVRSLLASLAADGRVRREAEEFKGKTRYRYFRADSGALS